MRIHIVSNIDNGKGLERDYHLLRGLFEGWGHDVHGLHFQRDLRAERADLVIFLEVYEPRLAEQAERRWLIPNAEWWRPESGFDLLDFDLVLCKTREGLATFAALTPRARHLGFFSEDRFDPTIPRFRRFLHVPGGSDQKGTDALLAAWDRYRIPYPLTVVSSLGWPRRPRNVELVGRIDERRLRWLQNAARFHLCPSRYEGWGHVIHEGLSTGAAVVVPDTPAMNEIDGCALRVPASPGRMQGLARTHTVSTPDVRDAIERCMAFTEADLRRISEAARDAFQTERDQCIARLRELLDGSSTPSASLSGQGLAPPDAESLSTEDLVRAVRAVAAPVLRGLYGGVVVVGDAAADLARDVERVCGLASRAVSVEELAALPASYACGVLLSNVFAVAAEEEKARLLREARRVVKATGPIVVVEIASEEASPRIPAIRVRTERTT